MRSPTSVRGALSWFFATWRFPSLVLLVLVFYELLLFGLLFAPDSAGALGTFAKDFKIWCFGYDPATQRVQPMSVVMMLTEPVILSVTMLVIWWRPLREVVRTPRQLVPWALAAFVLTGTGTALLGGVGTSTPQQGELPFPAERLRTAHTPPGFSLVDHTGASVSLEELRGRVVLLTAVYASCGFTCPMIMGQAKRAVGGLTPEEQASLSVVGITLDPENDTPEVLARMAEGQQVKAPLFRLATGDPDVVNALLDDLQVARVKDPQTGVIDHANLFVLVDRSGRIAYRFSLGERQERWLESALKLLTREALLAG